MRVSAFGSLLSVAALLAVMTTVGGVTSAGVSEVSISGPWEGQYVCPQGPMRLVLTSVTYSRSHFAQHFALGFPIRPIFSQQNPRS